MPHQDGGAVGPNRCSKPLQGLVLHGLLSLGTVERGLQDPGALGRLKVDCHTGSQEGDPNLGLGCSAFLDPEFHWDRGMEGVLDSFV